MLNELRHYENLGSPKFFWELSNQLENVEKIWTSQNIQEYFFNRIIDGRTIFDGCLPFAKAIGLIKINSNNIVRLDSSFVGFLVNERYLYNKIIERIFLTLRKDEAFYEIFCSENVSYDIVYHLVQINNSAFRFKYRNLRQLLIDFNFLNPHPDQQIHKLIINSKYKKFFDRHVLDEIKKRKIGIDHLQRILEQKSIYGEEAETFSYHHEVKRLSLHPNLQNVKKISEYDVSAGYDIVSYENIHSVEYDRFIEVKSYSGSPNFHWSRNEIDIARIKKDKYYLYLVDRNRIKDEDYTPLIIKNPYESVLDAPNWSKIIEGYFIKYDTL